jgi:hypothetical protein
MGRFAVGMGVLAPAEYVYISCVAAEVGSTDFSHDSLTYQKMWSLSSKLATMKGLFRRNLYKILRKRDVIEIDTKE